MSITGQAAESKRHSGRQRKVVERYGNASKSDGAAELDDQDELMNDVEDDASVHEQDDDEEEFAAPKRARGAKKSTAKATSSKPRKARKAANEPRSKNAHTDDDAGELEQQGVTGPAGRDFAIDSDNTLFNAVKRGNAAYQTIADDWIESYNQDQGQAMAELVSFFLRCCGCNAVVDEHEAVDTDGVTSTLETIQDQFKQVAGLAYPLVSRTKSYKKFRSALDAFLSHLFDQGAGSELLYDDTFFSLFQEWIISLSSSHVRAFRHTATVIGLSTVTALCQVHMAVEAEFGQASRAKDAEEKKTRKDKAKLKDLDKIVASVHKRKESVEEDLISIFDALFVHRYRDTEPLIRVDCIKSLGTWMRINPGYFLEGTYLRYIGWVLSDDHKDVRQEAVRSLVALYSKEDNIGTMSHFTERFKGQIVRMAVSEVEPSVRIASIGVLRSIEQHGLLEPEQRTEIAQLIYSDDRRVRSAIAPLYAELIDEATEERIAELKLTDADRTIASLKSLANLLASHAKGLDGEADESDSDREESDIRAKAFDDVSTTSTQGRTAIAIEALYPEVTIVRDWQAIVTYLVNEDGHEQSENDDSDFESTPKAAGRTAKIKCLRPDDDEQTLLTEVLLTSLTMLGRQSRHESDGAEEASSEVSKALIEALPRLFAQHQTPPHRLANILALPRLVSLDAYLDLRQMAAYEQLWDNVIAQFTKQSDPLLISQTTQTIAHMLNASALANTNAAKLIALGDTLSTALLEALQGQELDTCVFEAEALDHLSQTISRIERLARISGTYAESLDDNSTDSDATVYHTLATLSQRAKLGYKDEQEVVIHALAACASHLKWQLYRLREQTGDQPLDPVRATEVSDKLVAFERRLEDLAIGRLTNVVEGVAQAALSHLLELNALLAAMTDPANDPDGHYARLKPDFGAETQARCAGFIEALIDRHIDTMHELEGIEADQEDVVSDEDDEERGVRVAARTKSRKQRKAAASNKEPRSQSTPKAASNSLSASRARRKRDLARLSAEASFHQAIAPFVQAVHFGLIDLQHASIVLPHYEHFGPVFDQAVKTLAQDVRDEALYGPQPDVAVSVIVDSLKTACQLYVSSEADLSDKLTDLARLLSNATVARGALLKIVKQLPAVKHAKIHIDLINWTVDRIAQFEDADAKTSRDKTLCLFKALTILVFGLTGAQALKVNNALTAALEKHSIEVPATTKAWEPLRAYQKRLVTAMSKDAGIKAAAKAKVKRGNKKGKLAEEDHQEADQDSENDRSSPQAIDDLEHVDAIPRRSRESNKRAGVPLTSSPKRRRESPIAASDEGGPSNARLGNDDTDDDEPGQRSDEEVLAQLSQGGGSVASLSDLKHRHKRIM